ncbi:hypothetical protein GN958_ATG15935 [Phytophthora infestans]|uniref:Uncharacterized protein n=1 Tax=Phytophthora infestans TaxID=4787 RepID=A0A8S9U7I9_PHYIN|nr:hypothetical protein GN958_ATG15935 [Phytophthora infestans]
MEGLADTATAPKNDTVVARDEKHSDTEIFTSDSEIDGDSSAMASSINLNDGDLRHASYSRGPCDKKCLEGRAMELEQFLCTLSQMTSGEKKQSMP